MQQGMQDQRTHSPAIHDVLRSIDPKADPKELLASLASGQTGPDKLLADGTTWKGNIHRYALG